MDPVTVAALAGAGSGLMSGFFGAKGQSDANKANKEIAQMNNEWSEKMLDKQAKYNIDQWNRESAYNTEMYNRQEAFQREQTQLQMDYNSLASQRQRAEEAGYSPWAITQGANAGSISGGSTPSSSTPHANGVGLPSPNGAVMQAVNPLSDVGNTVLGMLNWKSQYDLQQAQAQQIKIENQTLLRQNMANIMKTYSEIRNNDARERLDRQLYQMQPQLWQSEMDLQRHQAENAHTNGLLNLANVFMTSKALQWYDAKMRSDIALATAQTRLRAAEENWTYERYRGEVYNTLRAMFSAQGDEINTNILKRTANNIVEQSDWNTEYGPVHQILQDIFGTAQAAQNFRPRAKKPQKKGYSREVWTKDGWKTENVLYHY